MLKAAYSGASTMECATFDWHKRFEEGWENVKGDGKSQCGSLIGRVKI